MAKKYRSERTGKHIQFSLPRKLTGTARYASVNAIRGAEQSRRDDLESVGYVLIYLARKGDLPWIGLREYILFPKFLPWKKNAKIFGENFKPKINFVRFKIKNLKRISFNYKYI